MSALTRTFRFADFKAAFAFMTAVAAEAERQNHHPWWSNVYNVVEFRLYTHDAGNPSRGATTVWPKPSTGFTLRLMRNEGRVA